MSLDYSPLLELFPNSDNAATVVPWQDRIEAYLSGVVADWAEEAGIMDWEDINGFEIEVQGITSNNGQISIRIRICDSDEICQLVWTTGDKCEVETHYLEN